jgi:hypothetical protein
MLENRVIKAACCAAARAGLSAFSVALCVTVWLAALDKAPAQTVDACAPGVAFGDPPSRLPKDACRDDSYQAHEPEFIALAWQTFKFLVWPASSERGKPDKTRKITDIQGPRTFETLKADWETFRLGAPQPGDWDTYSDFTGLCAHKPDMKPGDLVLASFNKFGNMKEAYGPRFGHLLVAQNRTYVRYLAAYNRIVFDKIVNNGLYNRETVHGIRAPDAGEPVPVLGRQPDGAMTVKSAWVELPEVNGPDQNQLDPSRFYVRADAWVEDPQTNVCRKARVGLVGLHFVYKTPSRPQWIWSTFEHVDNVPEPDDPPGKKYTFNNGDRTIRMTDEPDPNYRIPLPQGARGLGDPPEPYQVERLQTITPLTMEANRAAQTELASLGSVWRYYKLVMVQWPMLPATPNDDGLKAPLPSCAQRGGTATANTIMETFLQTKADCNTTKKLTCMGCHNSARATDFIWSMQTQANSPDAGQPSSLRIQSLDALRSILRGD